MMGTFAWLSLLIVVGTLHVLDGAVRVLGRFRTRTVALSVLLVAAVGVSDSLAEPFTSKAIRPIGFLTLAWGLPALGILAIHLGYRSRIVRQVRWKLRRRGWFLRLEGSKRQR